MSLQAFVRAAGFVSVVSVVVTLTGCGSGTSATPSESPSQLSLPSLATTTAADNYPTAEELKLRPVEGEPGWAVIPLESTGEVMMLATDPATGNRYFGTPAGLQPAGAIEITGSGQTTEVSGYNALNLGELTGSASYQQNWAELAVPLGTINPGRYLTPNGLYQAVVAEPSPGGAAEPSAEQSLEPNPALQENEPTAAPSQEGLLPVSFGLELAEGWTYDVVIEQLPTLLSAVSVEDSPPGKARAAFTLEGDADMTVVSRDTGRTAPVFGFIVNYIYKKPAIEVTTLSEAPTDGWGVGERDDASWFCDDYGNAVQDIPVRLECFMVAQLGSEAGTSSVAAGTNITAQTPEDTAKGVVDAFAWDRLDRIELQLAGGLGDCFLSINADTGAVKRVRDDNGAACKII